MVLHHVAQGAGRVVVAAAAALHAEILGDRDLHQLHVRRFHIGSKMALWKRRPEQVLDGLFPEVVVDSVDLILAQHFVQLPVQLAARSPSRARTASRSSPVATPSSPGWCETPAAASCRPWGRIARASAKDRTGAPRPAPGSESSRLRNAAESPALLRVDGL